MLNRDDEDHFKAELRASAGKLDLEIDFHERGLFPPGAYHSEGHKDGMGLCLYLALMRAAADSWNKRDLVEELKRERDEFTAAVRESEVERWAVNAAVHYNAWASFSREELARVVIAYRKLIAAFRCPDPECRSWYRVNGRKGSEEGMKCRCGALQWNFEKKHREEGNQHAG